MKAAELPKSELAVKFDEWIASDEGMECSDVHSLITTSKYDQLIRHYLRAAFLAGATADNDVQQDICDKALEKLGIQRIPGTNTGHGHVWARPDGMKARCGGPFICHQCHVDATEQVA